LENVIPGFSRTEYLRLRSDVQFLTRKYEFNPLLISKAKKLNDFLSEIKKGSKRFRLIMSGRGSKSYRDFSLDSVRPIKTLYEQLNLPIENQLVSIGLSVWKQPFLDLDFRQYAFKFTQGLIHGNTVVSHFADVDRKCTFCKIVSKSNFIRENDREPTDQEWELMKDAIQDENRPHILWDCAIVQQCTKNVFHALWGTREVEKQEFFIGKLASSHELSLLFQISNMLIRQKIWNYKLAGILPKYGVIANTVQDVLGRICMKPDWRGFLPRLRLLISA